MRGVGATEACDEDTTNHNYKRTEQPLTYVALTAKERCPQDRQHSTKPPWPYNHHPQRCQPSRSRFHNIKQVGTKQHNSNANALKQARYLTQRGPCKKECESRVKRE